MPSFKSEDEENQERSLKWIAYAIAIIIFGLFVLASECARADDSPWYLAASIGRSEYPFKAWDQVSMPNTEANSPTMYALSLGRRMGKHTALEVGYYDFGSVTASGCYAEEPGERGWTGPGLNYRATFCQDSQGYAKGLAISGILRTHRSGYNAFLRLGFIRAKSMWSRVGSPDYDSNAPTLQLHEATTAVYPLRGVGIERGNTRFEFAIADIQPHGESAFGQVRAVMLTTIF